MMTMKPRRQTTTLTTVVAFGVLLAVAFSIPVDPAESSDTYTKTVIEGDNLLIVCNVTELPDLQIYWTRNNSQTPFRQNGTELKFLDIRRTSSGDYICHEVNTSFPGDRVVEVVTIDVQYPATFDMSKTTREVHANKQLDVICTIDTHPEANMTLMNNDTGDVLFDGPHGSGIIDIGYPTAQWYMAGDYICTGHNPLNLGVNATDKAHVTVLSPPIPDPDANMTYNVKSFLNKDQSFYLEFAGYPPPNSIQWMHSGRVIPSSQQHDTNNTSTLNITHVTIEDFGEYVVTLTNEYGSADATYKLLPDGAPQRPTDLEYFDVTHNSVTLRWKSGFDMGSTQHFTVWKQVSPNSFETISPPIDDTSSTHGINQTWTYVQGRLDSDTEYNLTVDAENANQHYTSGLVKPPAQFRTLKFGAPQRPTDLEHFNVTYNSVTLRWESGFDMGSTQHFTVWKQVGPNSFETISPPIDDTSSTHGINQTWTYVQGRLDSDTEYNLTVDAENANQHYTSGLVKPPAQFRTLKGPPPDNDGGVNVAVIVGPSVGGVCVIALIVFAVHLLRLKRNKERRMEPFAAHDKNYQTMP